MGKWEMVRLGDVCLLKAGKFISASDIYDSCVDDLYPCYGGNGLRGYVKTFTHKGEYPLIGRQGALCGNVQYVCGKFYATEHAIVVQPSSLIYSRWLYYTLKSLNLNQLSTGAAQPGLNVSKLNLVQISLPPLQIQKQIADVLDKASALIELRRAQLDKLDLLIKSQFTEKFGDPIINQKQFPVYTVDDIIEFQGGSQPDKKYFEYKKTNDNIRLIQIRDYKSDRFITYIPQIMAKRFCTAEDIMIGRYGPPIFQILQGIDGSFNVALMKATPRKGNREFVRYFLKQECLLHYLEGLSQRTAGQDGIQMDKLKDYPFPYPPIELQNEFAASVERVETQKKLIQQSLSQLELNYKSLMQKCFRGEIF